MIDTPASNPMVSCMDDNDANFLVWLGNNGGAVSSDDCNGGPVVWTNDWDGTLPSGCAGSTAIMITFTATDDCGNPSETIGTYTITDGDDPTLNLPADDLVLECGNINNEAIIDNWLASVTGDDACSAVMVNK